MAEITPILPEITFVIQDKVGGVAYMNHQIIEYGGFMDHFKVHILLFKVKEDKSPRFTEKFKAHSVEYFEYSSFDNYYLALKRFSEALNTYSGVLVTNDGPELQAIRLFGTNSLVYAIVHDFYNLKLAAHFYSLVNVFVCHTEIYARTLDSAGPHGARVDFLPHGVKINTLTAINETVEHKNLRLVFIGRLVESKGVFLLNDIDQTLKKRGIAVEWTIIGDGELKDALILQWKGSSNVSFANPATNEDLMERARHNDVFVSPSVFEGYGIAMLEAMSCGLVPIVYDMPVGIGSLLDTGIGFRIKGKGLAEFADRIALLDADRALLSKMKTQARQFVWDGFNIEKTAKEYLRSFLDTADLTVIKKSRKISSFGMLDSWFFPNGLSRLLKKVKKQVTINQ